MFLSALISLLSLCVQPTPQYANDQRSAHAPQSSKQMKTSGSGRTYTQSKRKREGGLKECELGTKCPYQNEYQHNLEFCHTKDPQTIRSEAVFNSKGGVKLGGSKNGGKRVGGAMVNTAPERGFGTSGEGHRLGGGINGTRNVDTNNRHSFGAAVNGQKGTKSTRESEIFCENCFQLIPAHVYADHVEEHLALLSTTSASSSSNEAKRLRAAQDDEYEASVLADLEREEAARVEERRNKDEALLAQEEQALREAIAESERLAALATRQHATDSLLPEPPIGDNASVQIRFTLPSGAKVTRRFLKSSSVQQAFHFLDSLDSSARCTSLPWALRHVVSSDTIGASESSSLTELGLSSNCSLVALQVDAADAAVPTADSKAAPVLADSALSEQAVPNPLRSPRRLAVAAPPPDVVDLMQSPPAATAGGGCPGRIARGQRPVPRQRQRADVVDLTSP